MGKYWQTKLTERMQAKSMLQRKRPLAINFIEMRSPPAAFNTDLEQPCYVWGIGQKRPIWNCNEFSSSNGSLLSCLRRGWDWQVFEYRSEVA